MLPPIDKFPLMAIDHRVERPIDCYNAAEAGMVLSKSEVALPRIAPIKPPNLLARQSTQIVKRQDRPLTVGEALKRITHLLVEPAASPAERAARSTGGHP
jgi:hypothetical protein